ncbi:MAG: aminomethyl-transferring glycine dehydrogenase subunit GcvPB [Verrucomicrobiota bacterium]|nr:aminomethyl-transferring glycine dehydrogenase subunit GcvPB [Verrucomicrobiota bacterium]
MTIATTQKTTVHLPYDPATLPRELMRHYVSASDADIAAMLTTVGESDLAALYKHLPQEIRFSEPPALPEEMDYYAVAERMQQLASKNRSVLSFIGDGLPDFSQHEIVAFVSNLRNLTTAYTPYQPERSQGTLMTHWIYQSLLAQLTGFEAISSSLYDRASALFEAVCVSIRLAKEADTVLIPEALYPTDIEVVKTNAADTHIRIETLPLDPRTGRINLETLEARAKELGKRLAAIVFPQVNNLGLLEDVDALANLANTLGVKSIAVIDPLLLATGGLKQPTQFGKNGVDMIVGDAQHLAIAPNFGGPGLGLFGIRFNEKEKNAIRQTPGRYVGKAFDLAGRECRVMVLSTREQHIRKDKATSNICSNQAFLATLAGAATLARGELGMAAMVTAARANAMAATEALTKIPGVKLAYPDAPFFNEITLELATCPIELAKLAREEGIHIGVRVTDRVPGRSHLLKLSFSDKHTLADIAKLVGFFEEEILTESTTTAASVLPATPANLLREGSAGLPQFTSEEVRSYYLRLSELNVSPDTACYPLGSCTMKYNPYINDWAAGLEGLTQAHPQAPIEDVQGSLEILYEIQEWFKKITGLAAVTTQPVAGAQGELVGLKLFQAYHRSHGQHRDVLFIPKSAHGTNFATAAMAGFESRVVNGVQTGIVLLEADARGQIDLADFEKKLAIFGSRLAGVMITNPNTSGLFETDFKKIADAVHAAGGLVYMDGANMNAIAGWANLGAMGVDAVHNNLHKTWTIPHGGGGPGDGIVAVSDKLVDFLPGYQIVKDGDLFRPVKAPHSIGSFHRHWGNFAHKVRALAYLYRLGRAGVPRVMAIAVLSARYLFENLRRHYPTLPAGSNAPRMHEFILTLSEEDFQNLEKAGTPRASVVGRIGKLFLDFGFHAPTVAWPEQFGLMIEPTESYTKDELDRFSHAVVTILKMIREHPEVLLKTPFFTPVDRIDDVSANRNLVLWEPIKALPPVNDNRVSPRELAALSVDAIYDRIVVELGKKA